MRGRGVAGFQAGWVNRYSARPLNTDGAPRSRGGGPTLHFHGAQKLLQMLLEVVVKTSNFRTFAPFILSLRLRVADVE